MDVIKTSNNKLKEKKPKKIKDIYIQKSSIVDFSNKMKTIDTQIKDFLKHNMYNHPKVLANTNKGRKIIKDLFIYISKKPKKYINKEQLKNSTKERAIADFIAGMTDRYAINLHKIIK